MKIRREPRRAFSLRPGVLGLAIGAHPRISLVEGGVHVTGDPALAERLTRVTELEEVEA
jgi:hypothetical protein